MSMHEVAQHLSAMGRNGDSVLVHMSPDEVKALHGIGAITGSELTINPKTGLPEAFSFGNFFKSLVPTIVGAVASPFIGPLGAVLAGAGTGAALNKDNPLMGALTGGLGGFGGAGIGGALGKAAGAAQTAGTAGSTAGGASGMGITAAGGINPEYVSSIGSGVSEAALPTAAAQGTRTFFGPAATAAQTSGGIGSLTEGIGALGSEAGRTAYTQALGGTGPNASLIAAGKTAMPFGMAALSGVEPPPVPGEEKYDPYATLNLGKDTGLKLFASGGETNLESQDDKNPTMGHSPYGFTSLNSGGMGYARGGYLNGPGDGMSDSIPATIEGKQPARLADGEFVIPADVVSHLGNGSTKAGAQRLYEMLDKVRKARTGHTKQGKQINPNKYLPA